MPVYPLGWDMGVGQRGTWEAEAPGSPSAYRPPDPRLRAPRIPISAADQVWDEPTGLWLDVIEVDGYRDKDRA